MTNSLLNLAEAQEIVIAFVRPDGTKGSTPIWDVEVGGQIYIRSGGGTSGGWYRRLRQNPDGEVQVGVETYPVHAEPVDDAEIRSRVTEATEAYLAKYGDSSFLTPFTQSDSVMATLRLVSR